MNDKDLASTSNKIKHVVIGKTPRVTLCEFKGRELPALGDKKIEFKVFMNTDQLYSAALGSLAKNIEKFYKDPNLRTLAEDDLLAVNKCAPFFNEQKKLARHIAIMSGRWGKI